MHDIILKYFPDLSDQQIEQFKSLYPAYEDWNSKINVISRKDFEELYIRHVLHSLGIAKYIEFLDDSDILDVGTGGGFPGIPLAILFPNANFHLVDSIGKKITVVQKVAKAAGLTNIKAEQIRAEQIDGKYDFVVSRAVTRLKPFHQWIKGKFKKQSVHSVKNGIFYLKGGDLAEELQESKLRYKLYNLSDNFKEPFFETKKVLYVPQQ